MLTLDDSALRKEIKMKKKAYVAAEMQFMTVSVDDIIRTSLPGITLPDIELTGDDVVTPDSSDINEY